MFTLLYALATAQVVTLCAEFNGNCVDCVETAKCEFVPSSNVCRARLIVAITPVPPIDGGGRLTKMFQKRQTIVRTASNCPVAVSRFTKFDLTLDVPVRTLTLRVPFTTTTPTTTADRPTTSAPSFSEAPVLLPTTTIFMATPQAKTTARAGANVLDKDVDATDGADGGGGETNWAAIGGAIGGVVVLLAIGLAAFFIVKGRKALRDSAAPPPPQVRAPAALPPGSDVIIGQYETVPASVVEKTPPPPKDRPAAALPMYQSASLVDETGTGTGADDDTYVQLALHA